MKETAFAKVNLALHIRRKMENGYHDLETVFAFVDAGDEISVAENQAGDEIALTITGRFGEGLSNTDNLVLDAAKLLIQHTPHNENVVLTLNKMLPIASGIGGGSADAAATLRLLNRYWELDIPLQKLAKLSQPLGADVPACVISQTCSGMGIGQDLEILPDKEVSGKHILLINPLKAISTAEIFTAWDGQDRGTLNVSTPLIAALKGRNDLEPSATKIVPEISDILSVLNSTHPMAAKMSGSGATCFAIYEEERDAQVAERKVQSQYPNYWMLKGKLL